MATSVILTGAWELQPINTVPYLQVLRTALEFQLLRRLISSTNLFKKKTMVSFAVVPKTVNCSWSRLVDELLSDRRRRWQTPTEMSAIFFFQPKETNDKRFAATPSLPLHAYCFWSLILKREEIMKKRVEELFIYLSSLGEGP